MGTLWLHDTDECSIDRVAGISSLFIVREHSCRCGRHNPNEPRDTTFQLHSGEMSPLVTDSPLVAGWSMRAESRSAARILLVVFRHDAF